MEKVDSDAHPKAKNARFQEKPGDKTPPDNDTRTPPVLTEKNRGNKMISPVLFKLRSQEKRLTPPNLVPPDNLPPHKILGFPAGRYMSPTDSIMSPISRNLLARSRRSMKPPQFLSPPKALDTTFENAEPPDSNAS